MLMIADKTDLEGSKIHTGYLVRQHWVPFKATSGTSQDSTGLVPLSPIIEVVAQKVTKISSICLSRMVMPRDWRRQPTKLECGSGALSSVHPSRVILDSTVH